MHRPTAEPVHDNKPATAHEEQVSEVIKDLRETIRELRAALQVTGKGPAQVD